MRWTRHQLIFAIAFARPAIAYGSLGLRVSGRCRVMLLRHPHVASIGGIQNFASNLAGIVTTTFTGVMLTITSVSYVVPLVVAGVFCVVGAAVGIHLIMRKTPLSVG